MPLSGVAVRSGLPAQISSVLCTEAKNAGVATIKPDPKSKIGKKVISLTAAGQKAQDSYGEIARAVEAALGRRGKDLRRVVEEVFSARGGKPLRIVEGLMSDPRGTLPHYPVWDQNRGFGP